MYFSIPAGFQHRANASKHSNQVIELICILYENITSWRYTISIAALSLFVLMLPLQGRLVKVFSCAFSAWVGLPYFHSALPGFGRLNSPEGFSELPLNAVQGLGEARAFLPFVRQF